ncbi:hypothetical protein [Methylovirgula sp. 4M-Z18]|uniref:hypothetical protein n=1 Tax=Methylovirgula sp. 4M-Z18 TaxID=2293567 RepID=UPI000E2EEDE1|nr:hypothetical protein [Methylovirgula sp. 4M-Z18]
MRFFYLAAALIFASAAAQAQQVDFSGNWSVVGDLSSRRGTIVFMSTCGLDQIGSQVSGTCEGQKSSCALTGVVKGNDIRWTCRTLTTDQPNLTGAFTFRGAVGNDHIVHGTWGHSRFARRRGYFFMVRV